MQISAAASGRSPDLRLTRLSDGDHDDGDDDAEARRLFRIST
jgi:hypothetical protein